MDNRRGFGDVRPDGPSGEVVWAAGPAMAKSDLPAAFRRN